MIQLSKSQNAKAILLLGAMFAMNLVLSIFGFSYLVSSKILDTITTMMIMGLTTVFSSAMIVVIILVDPDGGLIYRKHEVKP